MKKLSFLTKPAIALGVGVLCAPQALAVSSYTLNQTNINAAAAAAGHNTGGIFCDDGGENFCKLNEEGNWIQEGDIDLTTVEINAGTPIRGLVIQDNVNISNPDNATIKGNIDVTGAANVTLTDLNLTGNLNIANADAEVTIDGGTYTSPEMSGALNVENSKSVTVNNATFSTGDDNGASAAYISGGDITITGGSFTSNGDNGVEFSNSISSLNISGGTFSGGATGIAFGGTPTGTISLTGGTFTGTGTDGRAIMVLGGDDTSVISNMLASGYHFTNDTIESDDGVYIAGTTTVASDNESKDSEQTIDSVTVTSTKKNGIGAPDTGAPTAESSNAKSDSILAAVATFAVVIFGAILVKKHSKKEA